MSRVDVIARPLKPGFRGDMACMQMIEPYNSDLQLQRLHLAK